MKTIFPAQRARIGIEGEGSYFNAGVANLMYGGTHRLKGQWLKNFVAN
jgi:hypothetical protein